MPNIEAPGPEPEFQSATAESIREALDGDMRAKRESFKGYILAPYNRTYVELAMACRKPCDSMGFFALSLVYLMLRGELIYQASLNQLGGNIEAAEDAVDSLLPIEVETDIETFRLEIRKWSRKFTDADVEKAGDIITRCKQRCERAEIEVTSEEEKGTGRGKSAPRKRR